MHLSEDQMLENHLLLTLLLVKKLAKTSGKPGKTKLINHFLINDKWYLVDLPGYGYATVSKTQKEEFQKNNFFLFGKQGKFDVSFCTSRL